MTPERQKWWDSLPKEEKKIRKGIEDEKEMLSHFKNVLKYSPNKAHYKNVISKEKSVIKALRKQIAQYPYRKDTHRVHCPNCWVWIVECYNEPPYCKYCGQKLRWKK